MRILVFITLSSILASCSSDNDRFNRGYVISQSQVESEKEVSPSEDDDHH